MLTQKSLIDGRRLFNGRWKFADTLTHHGEDLFHGWLCFVAHARFSSFRRSVGPVAAESLSIGAEAYLLSPTQSYFRAARLLGMILTTLCSPPQEKLRSHSFRFSPG
jgi:hypothetical protein